MDIYAAALPGCPRLGAKHMRALMDYFETAEDVWKASAESIEKSHILTGKTLAAFLAYRNETSLEQIEEKLYRLDIRCSTFEDSDYPPLLSATANPPAVLFYRGALPCFERTIAIVGSRKATAYGIETAHELARGLSAHGITIVSGGARGIDSASHTGAMEGFAYGGLSGSHVSQEDYACHFFRFDVTGVLIISIHSSLVSSATRSCIAFGMR